MHDPYEFQLAREHREELLREAERSRLARELRAADRNARPRLLSRVGAALKTRLALFPARQAR